LAPAFVFDVREAADFIGAGDFDGDGHWDVVTAARGSNKLYLMTGDGNGGLREAKRIDLEGGVTAMAVGEINRRDGLDDVVVGVSGEQGAKVLVFEGPDGALRANPETFDLRSDATALALGQLDEGYEMDLAIAAGREFHEAVRQRHFATERLPALAPQSAAWLAGADAELGRLEGASDPDAWAASVSAWQGLGRPYAAGYARWRQAEALLAARGDRKLAAALLREVVGTARTLGAEPLEREADGLALRARISLVPEEPGPPEPAPDDAARLGLTAREREVLVLVAAGRTNRQIGEQLFISEKTAGVHVSNILGKLGVAGRGEAAALAHQLGLAGTT
jgi:DNA-binding CsgD family transcriptional regulator